LLFGGALEFGRWLALVSTKSLEYPVAMRCNKSWPGPGTFQFRLFCFCAGSPFYFCYKIRLSAGGAKKFDEREINKFNFGNVNQELLLGSGAGLLEIGIGMGRMGMMTLGRTNEIKSTKPQRNSIRSKNEIHVRVTDSIV